MNILIVYAHPDPSRSFNAALKDTAVKALAEQGNTVIVSDLYAMNFKAVGDAADFSPLGYPEDIQAEMKKVEAADLIIFNFPLWWYGVPAILKGWVDRVFASGFAYGGGKGVYEEGVFRGKKAMLTFTTGSVRTAYGASGDSGEMHNILFPVHHGVFYYVGMDVMMPFIAYSPARVTEEERKKYLNDYSERLKNIFSEKKMERFDQPF